MGVTILCSITIFRYIYMTIIGHSKGQIIKLSLDRERILLKIVGGCTYSGKINVFKGGNPLKYTEL